MRCAQSLERFTTIHDNKNDSTIRTTEMQHLMCCNKRRSARTNATCKRLPRICCPGMPREFNFVNRLICTLASTPKKLFKEPEPESAAGSLPFHLGMHCGDR